jgi:hypothetical protein
MIFPLRIYLIIGLLFIFGNTCHFSGDQINPAGYILPTPTGPYATEISSHTFSNPDLSFEYPENFYRFNEIWPDLGDFIQHNPEYETDEILNTGDGRPGSENGYSYRIAVMQRSYTPDLDMEQVYTDAYKVVRDNYPDKEFTREDTSLAGKDAVQFTLQRPSGEPWWKLRDIWVVQNQSIYIFTYWAYPSHFEDGLHYFDETMETIRFLD